MPHIAMQKGIFYNAICVLLLHKGYLCKRILRKIKLKIILSETHHSSHQVLTS